MNNISSARLNGTYDSTRVGTILLLGVMPGDELELAAKSYWVQDTAEDMYVNSATMSPRCWVHWQEE